jgi:hypothetical protein
MGLFEITIDNLGRFAKAAIFPKNLVLRILTGPLKSSKWLIQSANIECFLGTYEKKKANLFADTVKKGMIVYDIGAHVGYYTLIAARKSPSVQVVAFEPSLTNMQKLKANVAYNNFKMCK